MPDDVTPKRKYANVSWPVPPEIQVGSVVCVPPGPPMTVLSIEDGHALCSWFDDEHSPREADFSVDSLVASK